MRACTKNFKGPFERGSVLLEVVLALALFVAAATVISSGINASVQAVHRLRLNTHASNLAISLMSELQMQARPVASVGPEPFPAPYEPWTYQIVISPLSESALEGDALQSVEVIVRHPQEQAVYRISQLFRSSDISTEGASTVETEANPGGLL